MSIAFRVAKSRSLKADIPELADCESAVPSGESSGV